MKTKSPQRRLKSHIDSGRNNCHTKCARWVRSLVLTDLSPSLRVVDQGFSEALTLSWDRRRLARAG